MAENDKPLLVSIIMPAYNAGKYIIEAINSIFHQSYQPIEIIVVDDGSTDDTLEKLQSLQDKIKLITSTHHGAANARNIGIKQAQGDLIAFLDADDTIDKDKIKLQIDEFLSDPDLDICYTMFNNFLCPEASEELKKTRPQKEGPIKGCVCGTTMIKKSSFENVGYFDSSLKVGEFIDWFSKATELGFKIKFIEKDLYNRRSHAGNTTTTQRESFSDFARLLKAKLDRKKTNVESN